MTSKRSPFDEDLFRDHLDFSLVMGGPLFQLLRRAHISGDALELVRRRTIVLSLFAWLPLLLLSALEGRALGGDVAIPFLKDVEVQVRFLVALPLLVVAELVVHQRMRNVVRQFLERELIPANASRQFDAAIAAAFRLRNSRLAELLLIAFVYLVGVSLVWRGYMALDAATWYATPTAAGTTLSLGGMWYGYVSLPVFQFLLLRWYFRLFVWARFLWHVSRIDLSLVPTHPDGVGGLGFLSHTAYAFVPLAAAHGAMLSAMIASRIVYMEAGLLDFKVEAGGMLAFLMALVFGPLLVFTLGLAAAKRRGLQEYGTLASRYVRDFDAKWLRGGAPGDEPLVGSADLQSLADLGNSFDLVRAMRVIPISRDAVIQIAAAMLAPIAPLLLTMMSPEDLLRALLGLLF
jgi:hypothetical protein